jgi:hypothetical protein
MRHSKIAANARHAPSVADFTMFDAAAASFSGEERGCVFNTYFVGIPYW